MINIGDRFLRSPNLQPEQTERGNWLVRTDGYNQTRHGMVVFLDTLTKDWEYVEVTRLSRNGKAAFGVTKRLCKCQRDIWPSSPDLRDCVCEEIEKPTAYIVILSSWDKTWAWAGHAGSPEEAEANAKAGCPFTPDTNPTVARANKWGVSAKIWRNNYVG